MAEVVLDGSEMNGQSDFYRQFFGQVASFMPDYGGRNLDALHDDLRDLTEPLTVVWRFSGQASAALGGWFKDVLSVLQERDPGDQPITVVLQ